MNGALVPRKAGCWICERVASPEDVTVRLFGPDGIRLQGRGAYTAAANYVKGMGYTVSHDLMIRRLKIHGEHVELSMDTRLGLQPALPGSLAPVVPPGPAYWLDVNQNAVNVGNDALSMISSRMPEMEDKELVAVAKIGVTAAQKVGDWEAKGRKLAQIGDLIRLASGFVEVEGTAVEVAP
jgi:hypothetical protein